MATCATCNTTILFAGKKSQGLRFCNDDCMAQGLVLIEAQQLPHDVVMTHTSEIHRGLCPVCGGRGPVDVHTSHEVWTILTRSKSLPRMSCRSCSVEQQTIGWLSSALLGCWGLPWGLIMTTRRSKLLERA